MEVASGGTDLVNASVTCTLFANVENLTLIGISAINATGKSAANTLTGDSAANIQAGVLDKGCGGQLLI